MMVTLVWMNGETEAAHVESAVVKDTHLELYPMNYGYSYSTPVRKIPLASLREWRESR